MRLRKAFILMTAVIALLLPACKKESEPEMVAKQAPVPTVPAPQVLVAKPGPDGKQQYEAVDPQIADDVNQALKTIADAKPEQPSDVELAAAKDPSRLLGKWRIVHTIHSTNGKAGPPSPPLAPTVWNIEKDGRLNILGGMKLEMRYVYTGDRLILTGLGPKLDYRVVKLTKDRLEVQTRIEAGTTLIENTTVLKRL